VAGFGSRLRKARKRKGWTLLKLARRVGSNTGNLSAVESGRNSTTLGRLVRICRALDVSADYLLGLKGKR